MITEIKTENETEITEIETTTESVIGIVSETEITEIETGTRKGTGTENENEKETEIERGRTSGNITMTDMKREVGILPLHRLITPPDEDPPTLVEEEEEKEEATAKQKSIYQEIEDAQEPFDPSSLSPLFLERLNEFLRSASEQGQKIWVQHLLQKGADVNAVDSVDHKTALDKAIIKGHQHIVEVLLPKASPSTVEAALKLTQQLKERSLVFLNILQGTQNQDKQKDVIEESVTTPKGSANEGQKDVSEESGTTPEGGTNEEQKVSVTISVSEEAPATSLEEKVLALEREKERVKAEFERYKKEQATQATDWLQQTQKLTAELNKEIESRKQVEGKVEELEKEMQIRNLEISSVKIERDTERRAKENAKRILSLDSINMPAVPSTPNPSNKPKLTKATSATSISFKDSNTLGGPPALTPGPPLSKSRDDMEQVMENQVRSRVRRLVRRWEDMKNLP